MLLHGFKNAETHMFLREDMEHNKFNYLNDIIQPMKHFFKINGLTDTKKLYNYN